MHIGACFYVCMHASLLSLPIPGIVFAGSFNPTCDDLKLVLPLNIVLFQASFSQFNPTIRHKVHDRSIKATAYLHANSGASASTLMEAGFVSKRGRR